MSGNMDINVSLLKEAKGRYSVQKKKTDAEKIEIFKKEQQNVNGRYRARHDRQFLYSRRGKSNVPFGDQKKLFKNT